MYTTDHRENRGGVDSGDEEEPTVRKPTPVTPKLLVKALKSLKKKSFKALFHTPREVTAEILKNHPAVQQDYKVLYLEVSDKLACAAAAGLIGTKQDVGYYAHNMRQKGVREDSRSELMFWILYKRLLGQKSEGQNLVPSGNDPDDGRKSQANPAKKVVVSSRYERPRHGSRSRRTWGGSSRRRR